MQLKVRYTLDEEGGWTAEIIDAEIKGVLTDGRSIAGARARIRSALELAIGEREALEAELIDEIVPPQRLAKDLSALRKKRERARKAQEIITESQDALRSSAAKLVRDVGLSVRDAAEVLDLSPMRVQQLIGSLSGEHSKRRRARGSA
ncbi:MAG: type II toxin-antitoxin system HicB family antitoxin [Deltaproteobacteria bacterium]|nr:type II toxin-antitoxin system HicB family antitoxin [Deltaproteobacteria bacterium]